MPSSPTIQPTAPEMERPLTLSTATHAMTLRKRKNRNAKPPPTEQKAKRFFRLMDLPLELRFQVYHHLLSAGYVSLLRVSRTVSKEASSILFSSAFFRTVIARREQFYPFSYTHTKPGRKTCVDLPPFYHLLQNVSFRVDLYFIEDGYYVNMLDHVLGVIHPMRRRKCCSIVFERAAAMTSRTRDFVIHFLEQFWRFEEVIVTVKHDHALFELAPWAGVPPVSKEDSEIDRYVAWVRNGPLYDIVVCSAHLSGCLSSHCLRIRKSGNAEWILCAETGIRTALRPFGIP